MKFGLISILILFVVGCSKDDDKNIEAADRELVANVDGEVFKASTRIGATFYSGFFRITAMNDLTGETIVISVSDASEGTFDLGPDALLYNSAEYKAPGDPKYSSGYQGGSGEINITSLDVANGTVSGTFSFTAIGGIITGPKNVTNGEFKNVVLATDLPISADVDGEAFNTTLVNSGLRQSKIFIIALNGNDERLELEFPGDITIGIYEFGTSSNYKGLYHLNFNESAGYLSESGTLTITSFNTTTKMIEGTFNFTAKRRNPSEPDIIYEITAGNFSTELQ